MPISLSRRELLISAGGAVAGGALAVAGGLSYRAFRRRQTDAFLEPYQADVNSDDGWLVSPEERAAAMGRVEHE